MLITLVFVLLPNQKYRFCELESCYYYFKLTFDASYQNQPYVWLGIV